MSSIKSGSNEVIEIEAIDMQMPYLIRSKTKRPVALQQTIRMKNRENIDPQQRNGSMVIRMSKMFRKFSRPIHCEICEEEMSVNRNIFIADCGHKGSFCESCLQHYAIYTIQQFGRVRCPSSGCEKEMDIEGAFYRSLPANIQSKYRKVHRFYVTLEDPTVKMCPRGDCEGLVKVQRGAERVTCSNCLSEFCPYCFFAAHQGYCDDYELQFFEQTLHYRQCPRCKMVIDKFEGCNHMTCICKHEFCYVCSADWLPEHYQNHDQNGRFVPPHPQLIRLEAYPALQQNPAAANENQDTQSCSQKCSRSKCFYLTLAPRAIIVIVLLCLLIALFGVVIVLTILAFCGKGKRKNHTQTSSDRQASRKIDECIDDMCSGYFMLYRKLFQTFCTP